MIYAAIAETGVVLTGGAFYVIIFLTNHFVYKFTRAINKKWIQALQQGMEGHRQTQVVYQEVEEAQQTTCPLLCYSGRASGIFPV